MRLLSSIRVCLVVVVSSFLVSQRLAVSSELCDVELERLGVLAALADGWGPYLCLRLGLRRGLRWGLTFICGVLLHALFWPPLPCCRLCTSGHCCGSVAARWFVVVPYSLRAWGCWV